MIIITSDINKQTYIPTLGVFSPFLLFYKTKHPNTLEYVSVPQQVNFSHFFSPKKCATCFLTLASSGLVLMFFQFAKIYNSIINCAYSNSIAIPCADSTHFLCPNSPE